MHENRTCWFRVETNILIWVFGCLMFLFVCLLFVYLVIICFWQIDPILCDFVIKLYSAPFFFFHLYIHGCLLTCSDEGAQYVQISTLFKTWRKGKNYRWLLNLFSQLWKCDKICFLQTELTESVKVIPYFFFLYCLERYQTVVWHDISDILTSE